MVLKIITAALVITLISIILRGSKSEFVFPVQLVGGALLLMLLITACQDTLLDFFSYVKHIENIETALSVLIKGGAVCIAAKLTADVCKENGNALMADIVDLSARVMLLMLSIPLIEAVMKTALAFID